MSDLGVRRVVGSKVENRAMTSVFERGLVVFENINKNFALTSTIVDLLSHHERLARGVLEYDSITTEIPNVLNVSDGAPQSTLSTLSLAAATSLMRKAKKGELSEALVAGSFTCEGDQKSEEDNVQPVNSTPVTIDPEDLANFDNLEELLIANGPENSIVDPKVMNNEAARTLTGGKHENEIGAFHCVMKGAETLLAKLSPDESKATAINRPSENRVGFKLRNGHFNVIFRKELMNEEVAYSLYACHLYRECHKNGELTKVYQLAEEPVEIGSGIDDDLAGSPCSSGGTDHDGRGQEAPSATPNDQKVMM